MKNRKSTKKAATLAQKFAGKGLSKKTLIDFKGGNFDCRVAGWC